MLSDKERAELRKIMEDAIDAASDCHFKLELLKTRSSKEDMPFEKDYMNLINEATRKWCEAVNTYQSAVKKMYSF